MTERQVNEMFCPRCGQQSPDGVRFCPRCGLSLAGLTAYVAGNEFAPAVTAAPRVPVMTARRRGMRRGAKLMFFAAVLFPIFFLIAIAEDHPGPLIVPFMVLLMGLAVLAYARLFSDDAVPVKSWAARWAARKDLGAGADRPALGAPQFVPAQSFNQQRANTAEMVQPPSVTENTTRLLDKDS